ncbi:sigma-54-dependent transcriptional regulator [Rhodohalobacter sp. 8-1]|uniref:sigma-54-dependent transcriptional regulator n=1 Tax=Rhodohalobacter sp. 8-1 TaxID=3131972 RepID=UPI0030EED8AB
MPGKSNPTILVTDDEKSIRNSLREILEFENYTVLEAEGGENALRQVQSNTVDLMILDIKMKGMDGIEVLEKVKDIKPGLPVIMISGHGTIKIAVEATKIGAFDFIEKPPDLNRLLISVRNALSRNELIEENRRIRTELNNVTEMVGQSAAISRIKKTIEKVAPSTSRVLITGENGTGKELVARWIHEKSPRASKSFVDVNCAAIPTDLLESELFGHEKGAFTGASEQRIGKFEQASGGTLFLDEIGDMSLDAQSKVLRVLQENQVTRVGGSKRIDVDVRLLSATNRDLEKEIRENRFREDLFHRINVIPIHVPPLRERKEDIPVLAKWFLSRLSQKDIIYAGKSFSNDALDEMKELSWPGNIRQLQNAVERMALLSDGDEITRDDVIRLATMTGSDNGGLDELLEQSLTFQEYKEKAERYYLIKKLEDHDWNVSATADAIDIQRSHIYNKMKKYDIER